MAKASDIFSRPQREQYLRTINALSISVDDMMRNFKPMVKGIERWRGSQISDVAARMTSVRLYRILNAK